MDRKPTTPVERIPAYEKLGSFYLGRRYDADQRRTTDEPFLYDARDLTTHAVCVGMTGSGKTGLCTTLLEEAAIDGIPAIAVDLKGDLGNLALTFPKLRPEDFRPWIDEGEASRTGKTVDQLAAETAERWRSGLAEWDQDGRRIERLRAAAETTIYTPGSSAGRQLAVLGAFAPPPPEAGDEALRDRVLAAVSGVLTLLGLDADPVRSREHPFLSTLLEGAWRQGATLDLPDLIRAVQAPPFDRVGVFDLETFYPARDRLELAMRLNALVASPGFAAWREGEPLDVGRLLHGTDGRPRISVLSIAHLADAERMFFLTRLLGEIVSWMRSRPGTSTLRAILYIDEIHGYLPPVANPPSKGPLLTLLKQARAFGLGVVVATQNPIDLDYKALSNAGTWFLGRLQTERDVARVIDGLEGASASAGARFDRAGLERLLAGLESRVFLVNDVHEAAPTLFQTRWALSYLRGPLTREEIRRLNESKSETGEATAPAPPPASTRPVIPAGIVERFVPSEVGPRSGETLEYRPALVGRARVHFSSARHDVDVSRAVRLVGEIHDPLETDPWAESVPVRELGLVDEPEVGIRFGTIPSAALRPATFTALAKRLTTHVYRTERLVLLRSPELRAVSLPDESEGDFRARLADHAREERDEAVDKLRRRWAPKVDRLENRIRTALERVEKEESQYESQRLESMVSIGTSVLGALFGRKRASVGNVRRAGSAIRGVSRASREKQDIGRAERRVEDLRDELAELEGELENEIEAVAGRFDPAAIELEETAVRAKKSDVAVEPVVLAWVPWIVSAEGARRASPLATVEERLLASGTARQRR